MFACQSFIDEMAYFNVHFGTQFSRRRISMRHLKHVRVIAPFAVLLAILTVLGTTSSALAHTSSGVKLITVSSADPYANCSIPGNPGTNFANAEVEPWVSVNPANPSNIIGVWQQDRWNNGGAQGLVAGFSSNGGKSWSESTLPFSGCASGAINDPFTNAPYDRASDPWVSIGPDGTAYSVGLLATNNSGGTASGNNDTGVAAVTSSDGGKTWVNPNLIKFDQGTSPVFEATQFFNDKESVTADPTKAGVAYVVWDRLEGPSQSPDAILVSHAFQGPTWFSETTDGGHTWTGTRPIFDPGQNSQTIGNVVVVDPRTGVLYDFFEEISTTGSPKFTPRGLSVDFVSSSDGGNTWSQPTVVSAQQLANDFATDGTTLLRTGAGLPSAAIDASNGQLYVVWEDARFTGGAINQDVISTSTNGGVTWSTPAVVSKTPSSIPAFTTTVAVNSAGTVAVTYYDMRNPDGITKGFPTDYWLVTSTDHGASFGNEVRLTSSSFDMSIAPNAGGLFLGDYEALANIGTTFEPFFVKTDAATPPTDVFTTFI
jgi:hypothetical protein